MDITDSPINSPKSPLRDASADESVAVPVEAAASATGAVTAASGGNLFVGKLAYDCRQRELEELFGKYGRITRCDIKRGNILIIITIKLNIFVLGYAFVEFEDERDATDAIKYLDGTRFLGFNITVERTKGEKRANTNPDGSKSRDCFTCGKAGHYAKECRSGRRDNRRDDRRDNRRDDRRDDRRGDRYVRGRSRSRSPAPYNRDRSYRKRDDSRSPVRRSSRSPVRRTSRSPIRRDSRSPVRRRSASPRRY